MKFTKLIPWIQIIGLSLISVLMLLAVLAGDSTWQWFGFGSAIMYAVVVVVLIAGLIGVRQQNKMALWGMGMLTVGTVSNLLAFNFFESDQIPGTYFWRVIGIAGMLLIPTGFYMWFWGVAKSLEMLKVLSLGTIGLNLLLYVIALIGPGNVPMKDTEMANLMVIDGLFLVSIFVAAAVLIPALAKQRRSPVT